MTDVLTPPTAEEINLHRFTFTDRVRPLVQIGVGVAPTIVGTGLWDMTAWDETTWQGIAVGGTPEQAMGRWGIAHWDEPDIADGGLGNANWGGFEPEFLDITCDVHQIELATGRARTTDRFEVGFASLTLANDTGRYDLDLAAPTGGRFSLIPGRALRVGVAHVVRGTVWLWRGYIDEVIPDYEAAEHDVVVLNCVDALGEVGRTDIAEIPAPGVGANEVCEARLDRILRAAGWPAPLARIDPSATTMMATRYGASAADLLHVTVESDGGAIYGDLNGHVRSRGRDWQTFDATDPVDAYVGNVPIEE